uniref:Genome polyprotein n=1 Tax=Photeros flavivirus TaxID=3004161 RepID=A0A9C7GX53_9FLAV|nr:polyprotein [Photeros flavivirus]
MVTAGDFSLGPGEAKMIADLLGSFCVAFPHARWTGILLILASYLREDWMQMAETLLLIVIGLRGAMITAAWFKGELVLLVLERLFHKPNIMFLSFAYSLWNKNLEVITEQEESFVFAVSAIAFPLFCLMSGNDKDVYLYLVYALTRGTSSLLGVVLTVLAVYLAAYIDDRKDRMRRENRMGKRDQIGVVAAGMVLIGGYLGQVETQAPFALCIVVLIFSVFTAFGVLGGSFEIVQVTQKVYHRKMAEPGMDYSMNNWEVHFHDNGDVTGTLYTKSNTSFMGLLGSDDIIKTNSTAALNDGVYRVYKNYMFGLRKSHSVGVVVNGVLHIPWHATHGLSVWHNGNEYCADESREMEDVVSYGGKIQFKNHDGSSVQLWALPPGGDLSIVNAQPSKVKWIRQGIETDIWGFDIDFPQGTSGSPFVNSKNEIVGMYGTGIVVGKQNTYCSLIVPTDHDVVQQTWKKKDWMHKGQMTYVDWAPGAGKTRRVIKEAVQECKDEYQTCIVLAPTKVVVQEMRHVLGDEGVSYHIEGQAEKKTLITVMCHTTFFMRWLRNAESVKRANVYIMDEAHFTDPCSIAARSLIASQVDTNKAAAIFMTATFPWSNKPAGQVWSRHQIEERDLADLGTSKDTYVDLSEVGKLEGRKLMFVPTVEDTIAIASKYSKDIGKRALGLYGNVGKDVKSSVMDDDVDLIVCTDVAELGANYNVDVVIDTGKAIKPKLHGGDQVVLETINIGLASKVQRRGRVGRVKPGVWYRDDTLVPTSDHDEVRWMEAEILLHNLNIRGLTTWNMEQGPASGSNYRILLFQERAKFIKHLNDGYSVWSSYYRAITGDDNWLYGGPSTIPSVKKPNADMQARQGMGPYKDVKPMYIDDRTFGKKCEVFHTEFKTKSLDGFFETLPFSMEKVNEIVKAVGRSTSVAWDMLRNGEEHMPRAEVQNAWATMAFISIIMTLAGILILKIFNQSVELIKELVLNRYAFSLAGGAAMTGLLWYGGVELKVVVFFGIGYVVLLTLLMPEPTAHRSTTDNMLSMTILWLLVIVVAIKANEEDMMVKTKADLRYFFSEVRNWVVPVMRQASPPPVVQQPRSKSIQTHLVWGWIFMLMGALPTLQAIVRAAYHNKVLTMKDTVTTDIGIGFPLVATQYWKECALGVAVVFNGGAQEPFTIILSVATVVVTVLSMTQAEKFVAVTDGLFMKFMHSSKHTSTMTGEPIYRFDVFGAISRDPMAVSVMYGMVMANVGMAIWTMSITGMIVNGIMISAVMATVIRALPPGRALRAVLSPGGVMSVYAMYSGNFFPLLILALVVALEPNPNNRAGISRLEELMMTLRNNLNPTSKRPTVAKNTGEVWKIVLNSMTHDQFSRYRFHKVEEREKLHSVSRGCHKLSWLIKTKYFSPEGRVVDLGCGAGGWSQVCAQSDRVTSVKGYTTGHTWFHKCERPKVFETKGFNITTLKEGVDVYVKKVEECDTVMCDIGEQDPKWEVEEKRSIVVTRMMDKWLSESGAKNFVFKVLSPFGDNIMRELRKFQMKHGGKLVRNPYSRNSTHEMYYCSGEPVSLSNSVIQTGRMLMARVKERWERHPILPDIHWEFGTKAPIDKQIPSLEMETKRINRLEKTYGKMRKDKDAPYRFWKYYGSFVVPPVSGGGQALNGVTNYVLGFFSRQPDVADMKMTDCSPAGTQRVMKDKVDTKVVEPDDHLKKINEQLMEFVLDLALKNKQPRMCTRDEFISNLRSNAAIGATVPEFGWASASEAVQDATFWDLVDKERKLHLKGDCEMCVYNTMPKREKKGSQFGEAKSSRIIWYYWLGSRFLEFEALGFLNQDHVIQRENFPAGVGSVGLQYLGYILNDCFERVPEAYCEDTAGWDTRVSNHDLLLESKIADRCVGEHKKLVLAVYKTYMNKMALVRRRTASGKEVLDLVGKNDQRGSGEVVTYALNTITNARVQLGRVAEAEGVISPTKRRGLKAWLETRGKDALHDMAIAGDDCVVFTTAEEYKTSLWYINACGKTRKNMGVNETSVTIRDFERIDFCSHHFHKMAWNGGWIIAPCRPQAEIFGRWRIQQGKQPSNAESACLAKAYGQMAELYYFHRRDVRLAAFAVSSCVPSRWVPTGRTTWSVHQKHDWMTTEDMLAVWNRVWVEDNPYSHFHGPANNWSEVPRIRKEFDVECGSKIGTTERANWAKNLPNTIEKVRMMIGNEKYENVLMKSINRFADTAKPMNLMGI